MITKEMAEKIWKCHNEIEKAENLLQEMAKTFDRYTKEYELTDNFGRGQRLQLGVPSGSNGHQLFDVNYKLATKIIKKHIKSKMKELKKLNESLNTIEP